MRVRCSNDWECWVDGRQLTAAVPPAGGVASDLPNSVSSLFAKSVLGVRLVSIVGAGLVFIGSFLPWWSVSSLSVDAWNIPIKYLIAGSQGDGIGSGLFLLVSILVLLPLLTRRPLPTWAVVAIAVVSIVVPVLALIRGLGHSVSPGIGLFVTLIGGVLILVQAPGFSTFVSNLFAAARTDRTSSSK